MKQCPECYETYQDSERFCELDGQRLIRDPSVSTPTTSIGLSSAQLPKIQFNGFTQQREVWFVGTAGVVLGIVVCVGGYLAYSLWNDDSGFKEPTAPAFASQAQVPIQTTRPQAPRPEPTTTPEEEAATVEPEPSPEPTAPVVEQNETVAAKLNQGPVSTGQRRKEGDDASAQTIIRMNDGTAVEVDAAWEDGQGVWYRRGGMVAFVESQRVKSISGRATQKPSPVSQ